MAFPTYNICTTSEVLGKQKLDRKGSNTSGGPNILNSTEKVKI